MKISKTATAAVTALALLGGSTAATAAPAASKLSIAGPVRAGTKVANKNEAIGSTWIIAALVAAAVIVAVVVIADDNNNPTSA